jgi:phage shock protein A
MSSDKPGLFSRLKTAISSSVNDAVDSMSDPGAELGLMLDDLEAQIKAAEKDLKQGLIDKKVMQRKIEELEKEETSWQGRAEQALKLGDEDLARAALERKQDKTQELKDIAAALAQQETHVDEMAVTIKESKRRLKSLNLRRGSLVAQARAAKDGDGMAASTGMAAATKIDAIEDKIAHIEALNEVGEEMRSTREADVALNAKLAKLDGDVGVNDELEALKAKLRSQGALTDGKKEG